MAVNYDPRYLTYDKDEVQRILAQAAESAPQSTTYTKIEVDELVGDKYQKPESGIPKTDLANGVQESLTNADNHEFQIDTFPTKGDVNKVEYIVPSQASRSQHVTSNSLEQTNVIGYAGHSAYRYPTGISVPAGCAVRIATSRKCMWLTNAAGMYKLERFGDFYVNQTQNTKTVYVAVAPTAGDLTLYYYDTPLVTVQERLAQKQDLITDLDTIRTGAAAGATAYQKPDSGIPANDLSSDVQASLNKAEAAAPQADTYTKAEVDEAIADIDVSEQLNDVAFLGDVEGSATVDFDPVADTLHKGAQVLSASEQEQVRTNINAQEKLVSGQNIATINGSRIDQGGNVTIVAAEGQTITIDAAPTKNSNNAVSSGGVYPLQAAVMGAVEYTDITSTGTLESNALKADGGIQTNGQYKYYKIPNNGYTHISGKASTYSGFALVNFYSGTPGTSTFISGIVATVNYTATDYSADVPSNCVWICVAWYYGNGSNSAAASTCLISATVNGLMDRVDELEEKEEILDAFITKTYGTIVINPNAFTTAGLFNKDSVDGAKSQTTTYTSTGVYQVKPGQLIRFKNWITTTDVSGIADEYILCAYKQDGTKITNTSRFYVKQLDIRDYVNGEYTFIVPDGCTQIAFACKNTSLALLGGSAQIICELGIELTDKGSALVSKAIDEYNRTIDLLPTAELLTSYYIDSAGVISSASGYSVYKIPNNSYSKIKGAGSSYYGYLCVGFYNGEPAASTLISGWSSDRTYLLQPFELDVPEGCVFICISEYNATGGTKCTTIVSNSGGGIADEEAGGDNSANYYLKGNSNITYSSSKKLGIIAAGQSNIEGRNSYSDLPSGFVNPNSKVHFCNNVNGTFAPLEIVDGGAGNDWGFDVITYDALTNPSYGNQSEIYVMKKAMGGTSIDKDGATDYHWTADYEWLPSQIYSLLRTIEKTIRKGIETQGNNFEIKAFIWHQGEGDSGSAAVAGRYYNNLKNMLAYVRGVVGNPRLHFFCGTISSNNVADPYTSVVNAAYNRLASEDPYLHLIDMSNAQLEDSWHFNYQWSIYFGQKVYDAMIDAGIVSGTKINPTEPS